MRLEVALEVVAPPVRLLAQGTRVGAKTWEIDQSKKIWNFTFPYFFGDKKNLPTRRNEIFSRLQQKRVFSLAKRSYFHEPRGCWIPYDYVINKNAT